MVAGLKDYIFCSYYLVTHRRYTKPIEDAVHPMGSIEELYNKYGSDHEDLKRVKEKEKKMEDALIVGSSQYGVYFRLVKKSIVEK